MAGARSRQLRPRLCPARSVSTPQSRLSLDMTHTPEREASPAWVAMLSVDGAIRTFRAVESITGCDGPCQLTYERLAADYWISRLTAVRTLPLLIDLGLIDCEVSDRCRYEISDRWRALDRADAEAVLVRFHGRRRQR